MHGVAVRLVEAITLDMMALPHRQACHITMSTPCVLAKRAFASHGRATGGLCIIAFSRHILSLDVVPCPACIAHTSACRRDRQGDLGTVATVAQAPFPERDNTGARSHSLPPPSSLSRRVVRRWLALAALYPGIVDPGRGSTLALPCLCIELNRGYT